jgi:hypothetical protein
MSGSTNFRKDIATLKPYKGNRTSEKPKYYLEIRDYLIKNYGAIMAEGQEADDLMGIAQWAKPDSSTVICSIDKDLDMIPGLHYNDKKDKLYEVSLEEANRFFVVQLLTGDATDNIPGVPGIGPKNAERLLWGRSAEEGIEIVQQEYNKAYGASGQEAFEENARLLWIRRKENQEPPCISKKEVMGNGTTQMEDEDTNGQVHSEVGIREKSTDQTGGDEHPVRVRDSEDPVHDSGEDSHVYAGCSSS